MIDYIQTDTATYEDLLELGISLVKMKGDIQWQLGDLAACFVPNPTQGIRHNKTIAAYACDIGMNARTLQEYVKLALFYPPQHREDFPNLSYSHFRTALRFSDKQLKLALAYLEHASDEGLSCDGMEAWLVEQRESEVQRLGRQITQLKALLQEALAYLPTDLKVKVNATLT